MLRGSNRVLVIGCSYKTLHVYWRARERLVDSSTIVGFVSFQSELSDGEFFFDDNQTGLRIWDISELENVIRTEHVQTCDFQVDGLSMGTVQSIVRRVMATGECGIRFSRLSGMALRAFKPVFILSSLAPKLGKTQVARYFCAVLASQGRNVSVIVPMTNIVMRGGLSVSAEFSPHFELKENDKIPPGVVSPEDVWILTQYQKCGACRVYATSDIRRAIIQAEQHSDIILFDARNCEYAPMKSDKKFCVVDAESVLHLEERSLWPGLLNVLVAENIIVLSSEGEDRPDRDLFEKALGAEHKYYFATSKFEIEGFDLQEMKSHRVVTVDQRKGAIPRRTSSIGENEPDVAVDIPRCESPLSPDNYERCETEIQRVVDKINATDADVVVVSLQSDLPGIAQGKKVFYESREVVDEQGMLRGALSEYFPGNGVPPLQKHFETQVDIIMALLRASHKELFVTNNTSANREAFCRLFLESHLPPGLRVTHGEIIDSAGNKTGELEIVIVTDYMPMMTTDHTSSVITPTMADSVLGVLEVKTSLTADALTRAVSQLRPVKSLMPRHSTLKTPDGRVVKDPLDGKIITGIFAYSAPEALVQQIPKMLRGYPNVIDFVVVPNQFAYFSAKTLHVCGMDLAGEVQEGYVKSTSKGMGLALIFAILNVIAATRMFSGSNCMEYVSGRWEAPVREDQAGASHQDDTIEVET